MKKFFKLVWVLCMTVFLLAVCIVGYQFFLKYRIENAVLKKIISRLEADSRVAEVLVTEVHYDEKSGKNYTTIKFLEYDVHGKPLIPKYFSFSGNIIQFQSLVIRFDDVYIQLGTPLKGKSAYLFWKIFMLDGKNTEEFDIASVNEIPEGYKIDDKTYPFEKQLWQTFWKYALDPNARASQGIKNAQIEAPGTMFVPGILYTIKIEHDGGLRIDSSPISPILKGEKI